MSLVVPNYCKIEIMYAFFLFIKKIVKILKKKKNKMYQRGLSVIVLTSLSTIFQLYHGGQLYRGGQFPGVHGENHRPVSSH